MFKIENSSFKAILDDQARLLSFIAMDKPDTELIAEPASFGFKMTLDSDGCKECIAFSYEQKAQVSANDNQTLQLTFSSIDAFNGREHQSFPIGLTITLSADGDRLTYAAAIQNRSSARILDFTFPVVGKIRSLGSKPPALLAPTQSGCRFQNIGTALGRQQPHRENGSNSIGYIYPGGASMQWLALTDDERSLFLTNHDADFYPTELGVQGDPAKDVVTLSFGRLLTISPDTSLELAPTTLLVYSGDWHRGAREYAEWMAQYRPGHPVPEWVENMTGYFLVINKQQYGYEMWPYDTLPSLYRHAKAHGCDTVGLFGWYHSGHDNQYPDLEVSPTLGGEDALRQGIKDIQAQGGHVTLYYQGHLIDETSDFFRNGPGKTICSKNIWGSPYVEFYNKSHKSTFLKHFSRKMFAVSCPSHPLWQDLMVSREDWLASFGPDGCLYDQIGGCPAYPCFDPAHAHKHNAPALANPAGRQELLGKLQKHSKEIAPDFAFFSEHIVDMNSAYLDMCHGIGAYPPPRGVYAAAAQAPEICRQFPFPALFRYCFPDTRITLRNPAPFIDQRFAAFALAYGFILEMEFRYQDDKDDLLQDKFPQQRQFACYIADLRKHYPQTLLKGTFLDNTPFAETNPAVITTAFISKDKRQLACVFWNDTDAVQSLQPIRLKDRWSFVEATAPDGEAPDALPAVIQPGAIMVALYKID